MNSQLRQQQIAEGAAEEILRLIYGDDLAGCTVRPNGIADVVLAAMTAGASGHPDLLELFEKSNEAVVLLSNPPSDGAALTPPELQALLSDRLDTIHTLSSKLATLAATARTGLVQSEDPEQPPARGR